MVALHNLGIRIAVGGAGRLQFVVQSEVNGILGQLGVQFAGVALGIAAVIVVDTVGNVARLLDFGQQVACAYGMYTSGGQEEYIARVRVVYGQGFGKAAFGHTAYIVVGSHGGIESGVNLGIFIALDYVPHFGFAQRVVALACQFVVGVYLNRQVLVGIDNLNQQRKRLAVSLHYLGAEQLHAEAVDEFGQGHAFVFAGVDYRFMAWHGADFPAFAYFVGACGQLFVFADFGATPDYFFQIGCETYRCKDHIIIIIKCLIYCAQK